jgi:hypothetical protein
MQNYPIFINRTKNMDDVRYNYLFGFWPNLITALVFLTAGLVGFKTVRIKDAKKKSLFKKCGIGMIICGF